MKVINGGVCAPKGYAAAGVEAGIKKNRKDMALVYSAVPAVCAGVFTTNLVKAWCVRRKEKRIISRWRQLWRKRWGLIPMRF